MTASEITANEKLFSAIWIAAWRYAKEYPCSEIAEATKKLEALIRTDADAAIELTYKISDMLTA